MVDEQLIAQVGAIKVDFIEAGYQSGFSISTEKPLPGAGGGCSSGSCGGSCG